VLDTPTSEATPIAELSERAIDESSSSFVFSLLSSYLAAAKLFLLDGSNKRWMERKEVVWP